MRHSTKYIRITSILGLLLIPLMANAQIPHVGVWTSIDPHDGSRAYIGVDAALRNVFYDTDATFGCKEGGGGPFFGFDSNHGDSVYFDDNGSVLVGYINGVCQNGVSQNLFFDFGMHYFPDIDRVGSRGTIWDRTEIDEEEFVENAFALKRFFKLDGGGAIWEFMGSYGASDPKIVVGADCPDFSTIVYLFSGDDLRACEIKGAILTATAQNPEHRLDSLILREANLMGIQVNLTFVDSDLRGINYERVVQYGGLEWVDLRWSNLRGAKFAKWNEIGFQMIDVDLTGADLRGAIVYYLEPTTPSVWENVNFRRANLENAWFQEGTEVINPFFFNTICPDGTNSNDNGGTCDLTWSPY